MKRKSISITALIAVLAVMCVTVTVFASTAPEEEKESIRQDRNDGAAAAYTSAGKADEAPMQSGSSGEKPDPGDSGRSWVNLDQYNAKYKSWSEGWHAEWWTYEDYKAWLEQEKKNLQGIIGEKGYAGSTGWFTWDREMVDETIAVYEGILEEIKNGALYKKAIVDKDGREVEGAALGAGGDLAASVFFDPPSDVSEEFAALLKEAEAFGVTSEGGVLYYKGQLVHTLVEGRKVEGGYTYGCTYKNDNGTIDLQTQRDAFIGPDGYWNTSGALSGILSERDAGFDKVMTGLLGTDDAVWKIYGSGAPADADAIEAAFARYEKYGLVYLPRECGIGSMAYCGQPVVSFADMKPVGGAFRYEDPNVEAGLKVYTAYDQNGKLAGLRVE